MRLYALYYFNTRILATMMLGYVLASAASATVIGLVLSKITGTFILGPISPLFPTQHPLHSTPCSSPCSGTFLCPAKIATLLLCILDTDSHIRKLLVRNGTVSRIPNTQSSWTFVSIRERPCHYPDSRLRTIFPLVRHSILSFRPMY